MVYDPDLWIPVSANSMPKLGDDVLGFNLTVAAMNPTCATAGYIITSPRIFGGKVVWISAATGGEIVAPDFFQPLPPRPRVEPRSSETEIVTHSEGKSN